MVYYLTVLEHGFSGDVLLFAEIHTDNAGLDNAIVFMYTVGNYGKRVGAVVKLCRITVLNI